MRDEDEDLSYGAPDECSVVVDFHTEIQLDLLRSRDHTRQHQDRLCRRRSLQGEAGLRGARDTRWCAYVYQCHGELYRRLGLMGSPHSEQFQLTGGRNGQHAHEGDEVVGIMRGRPKASQVVQVTKPRGAYAAVFSHRVPKIPRRTVYPVTTETPASVLAHLVRIPADLTGRALVDVLTRSTVDTEPISLGTLARVASRRILADADAQMVVLEFRALVDVAARSVVGI